MRLRILNGILARRGKTAGNTGFSFLKAATVFGDPLAVTYADPDHSTSEKRFITVGMSSANRVLLVARGENIRIISARETTQRERKHYEETN